MSEDRALTSIIYTLVFINGIAGYYIHMLRRINRRLITQLNRSAIIHNVNPIVNAAPVVTIVAEEV
jgi:hypothetical protein